MAGTQGPVSAANRARPAQPDSPNVSFKFKVVRAVVRLMLQMGGCHAKLKISEAH